MSVSLLMFLVYFPDKAASLVKAGAASARTTRRSSSRVADMRAPTR